MFLEKSFILRLYSSARYIVNLKWGSCECATVRYFDQRQQAVRLGIHPFFCNVLGNETNWGDHVCCTSHQQSVHCNIWKSYGHLRTAFYFSRLGKDIVKPTGVFYRPDREFNTNILRLKALWQNVDCCGYSKALLRFESRCCRQYLLSGRANDHLSIWIELYFIQHRPEISTIYSRDR